MIRDEAMDRAIASAQTAGSSTKPEWATAFARIGDLWLGIADRLPIHAEPEPDASPTGLAFPVELVAEVQEEDGDPTFAVCGHRMTALLHRGRWLHPYSLDVCDDPPIVKAER